MDKSAPNRLLLQETNGRWRLGDMCGNGVLFGTGQWGSCATGTATSASSEIK